MAKRGNIVSENKGVTHGRNDKLTSEEVWGTMLKDRHCLETFFFDERAALQPSYTVTLFL